ncbi:MAG: 2-iminoacetate synthase ThiH [Bacteroidetes bacterium CG02_land_8_20_14_3_00_31_25]|nr:2-iminoacetate synthase ThiH [Bacteroidota bacterium]PIV62099.1 MAG: 2-iminoacetate synthase ThiH [Bacteroidetes bacterium CG02_land_8_20_14_3_00_31_25]PIY03166.1 MAG: 2-iminoacetate synthase ThiH [Bacteroidetes bacterium CG_4_10_14_3_um_filter_31_20]
MSFQEIYDLQDWNKIKESILNKSFNDVENALSSNNRTIEDFKALISPAAVPYLEQMAQISQQLTQKRFGKTIQLYVPLYLSNECNNYCTYCGFNFNNKIERKTLNTDEILKEISEIKKQGFNHILLVTGEARQVVNLQYLVQSVNLIKSSFANTSIEVLPLLQTEYEELNLAGVYAVLVYQETYNKEKYKVYHPKGKKSNFYFRLETPDRIGRAGIHKIGLGVLLGLEDWRTDSCFCALHLEYLQKKYWQTKYSISFPRIRPYKVNAQVQKIFGASESSISDKELVQLICAYRLFNEDVELSVSTRESETFRNNIIKLGVTSMSAGSKTNPGGYSGDQKSLEQFEIADVRNAGQIAEIIASNDYEPVWKDWDNSFL